MKVQEAKPEAQADWVTFIKGGAQTSTKWTFVRVVFILRKYYPSDECHDILLDLFDIFSVISVDDRKLRLALANKRFKDFEDCLQMECGRAVDVRYIVTRDASDFTDSDIPCLTPSKVCAIYSDTI